MHRFTWYMHWSPGGLHTGCYMDCCPSMTDPIGESLPGQNWDLSTSAFPNRPIRTRLWSACKEGEEKQQSRGGFSRHLQTWHAEQALLWNLHCSRKFKLGQYEPSLLQIPPVSAALSTPPHATGKENKSIILRNKLRHRDRNSCWKTNTRYI